MLKNQKQNVSGIVYCDNIPDLPIGHLVIIDGKSTMTSSDFLRCIGEQLKFPDAQSCNWDAYLDWMRDLSWLDTKSISIIILNFDSFLCKEPDKLKYFLSDLEEVVFPFWQNDAESVFESQDAVKNITVYCMRNELMSNEQVTTKEAMDIIRQNTLNGQKTPHSISQPVLRWHEGKVYFATFVFFYNKEQLQSAMVNRPTMWIISDLKTGEIVQRYRCLDNEFSNSEYQKLYNISAEDVLATSKFYWESTYALMDLIRHEYISCGTLNKRLYKEYLERIACTTPKEYQVFYEDLNNIEVEDDFVKTENKEQFQTLRRTGMFYYGIKKDFQGKVDKSTFFSNTGLIINTFGYYRNDEKTWIVFVTDDERGVEIHRKKLPTEEAAIEYLIELCDSQNFAHYSNTVMENFKEKEPIIIEHLKNEYGYSDAKAQKALNYLD